MIFSKATEYGIKAVIYIAQQSVQNNRVGVKAISAAIESPEPFTAKILQDLVRRNVVTSLKGPNGGFLIENGGANVTLAHIVRAIDGEAVFSGCGLGLSECSDEKPCPVHHIYKSVRTRLVQMLEETTVAGLSKDVNLGKSFLRH